MPRKHRRGQGTVYTRKSDGRVVVSLPPSGSNPRVTRYARTRAEGERLLTQLQQARAEHRLPARRWTVSQLLTRWLDDVVSLTREPVTLHRYRNVADLYLRPLLGRVYLDELEPATIQHAYGRLARRPLAPSTIALVHRVLHRALEVAVVTWRLLPSNPAKLTTRPSVKRERPRVFTADEVRLLLATALTDPWEAYWALALCTAMRPAELSALRWPAFGPELGTVTVRQKLVRVDGAIHEGHPKTAPSRRTLPLDPLVVAALRRHRARQQAQALALGEAWTPHGLLFVSALGTPMPPDNMRKPWYALLQRAGLAQCRLYTARHSVASLLLKDGVSATDVAAFLGHSTPALLWSTYGHAYDDAVERVGARLEALYRGENGCQLDYTDASERPVS